MEVKSVVLQAAKQVGLVIALGLCSWSFAASDWMETANRWKVRDFYQFAYGRVDRNAMEWSGSYAAQVPGAVSEEWNAAVCDRINFFRLMAGIGSKVTIDASLSEKAQAAAFLMSLNGSIDHTPPSSWPGWSADAAEGAGHSNLALGIFGPDAISGYIDDFGSSNYGVGHRRWLFYPQTTRMGNGDVPGTIRNDFHSGNALWVIPETLSTRPETREPFIAWPAPGYVPAPVVFARWSFSLPNADFSEAAVTMRMLGNSIPLRQEPVDARNVGEPTLVWVPTGFSTTESDPWPTPSSDEVIEVTVANVKVDSGYHDYTYEVIVFDPARAGLSETESVLIGPTEMTVSIPQRFSVTTRPWAEEIELRILAREAILEAYTAESPQMDLIPQVSGYSPRQSTRVHSGSQSYHLVNPDATTQTLQLPDEIIPGSSGRLVFASSLAWATAEQYAAVEVSVNSQWTQIWRQSGPVGSNALFESVSLDLSDYAGRAIQLRFRYDIDGRSYYYNTEPELGWAIDEIQLVGCHRIVASESIGRFAPEQKPSIAIESPGGFFLQAREFAFGGKPLGWGPVQQIVVNTNNGIQSVAGEWSEDPVVGWIKGTGTEWAYTYLMGWIYTPHFPWLYSDTGWFCYISGSAVEGLWLFNPYLGACYTSQATLGWFNYEPYDNVSWGRFSGPGS
jgi:hypothetical protein